MNSSVIDTISRSVPWALRQLRQYLPLLALPPLVCAVLAIVWIVVTPPTWKAHQSLLVRDDMLGDNFKPGRFSSHENQKNAQETLLHIARKPQVIRAALEVLGPEKANRPGVVWPSEELLQDVGNSISIFAPNGAEFGKTDVVVLSVKASSRERAKKFADLLAGQIELNLRNVRQDQLRSMQTELELATEQLQREYNILSEKVKQVELAVGSDLPVLRSLLDRSSSASDVQRALEQIRQERRLAENELEVARKQLELLKAIETDPAQFSVSSSELLTMQPIFKKLREGLTDAELRLLTESGRYEPGHPAILHAQEVIAQTKDQIRREASAVIQGLQSQTTTAEEKLNRLRASELQYDQRLARLAEQRVEYEVLAREMEKGGETLGKAKTELAQIQSLAESADKISLITRVGEPQAELRPEGLSKKSMVLLAILGGLLLGGGLVGLFYRPDPHAPWLSPLIADQAGAASDQNGRQPSRELRETITTVTAPIAAGSRHASPEPAAASAPTGEPEFVLYSAEASPAATSDQVQSWPAEVGFATPFATGFSPNEPHPESSEWPGETASFTPAADAQPIAVPQIEQGGGLNPRLVPTEQSSREQWAVADLGQALFGPGQGESAPAPNSPRPTPPPLSLPGKIDLVALKQKLSEAAKTAAPEVQTGEFGQTLDSGTEKESSGSSTAKVKNPNSVERTTAEHAAANPTANVAAKSSRSPAVTERIEFLSQSIATFCDAIRIEPPTEGSVS